MPMTYTGAGPEPRRAKAASARRQSAAARRATTSPGRSAGSSAQAMLASRWILWNPAAT